MKLSIKDTLSRLLAEPLVQFVAIGALLFALSSARSPDRLQIDAARLLDARAKMANLLNDSNSRSAMIVESDVRVIGDELLYREAQAKGLERDDPVIRQHLAQKLLSVAEEERLAARSPTEQDLRNLFDVMASRWREPDRASFCQIYSRTGWAVAEVGRLRQSRMSCDALGGDAFPLGRQFDDWTRDEVVARFGEQFATEVFSIDAGKWSVPIHSNYGSHLVLVTAKSRGREAQFEARRNDVLREWERRERQLARRELLKRLVQHYRPTAGSSAPEEVQRDVAVAVARLAGE